MLLCRPRCCLVDRLKAVAYGVEVVALQLAQVTAHTKPGYGMLPRLNVSADPTLYNLIVDDDLTLIAIQGNTFSRLVFCHDNKVISAERHGALGRTTAHVELAYGMLLHVRLDFTAST